VFGRDMGKPKRIYYSVFPPTMSRKKNSNPNSTDNSGVEEKRSPLLTIRDREYVLTVWADSRRVRLVVSRRAENGWERLAVFVIPTDYMLWKLVQVEGVKDIVSRII